MQFTRAQAVSPRIDVLAEAGSTNAELRERAADAVGWPHLSVVLTDNQTAGRGRLDRTWTTPAGASLAISVLLRNLPASMESRGWIPLLAGAAMVDAVAAQLPGRRVGVKWPNDVLVDGRKICGILAESADGAIVVGSGVNTAMTAEQLPVITATSFAALGATLDEDRLLTDYLSTLDQLLLTLAAEGPSSLHAVVTERCVTLGEQVNVSLPDGSALHGRATRLELDGRLVIADGSVEHVIHAGDIVHARLV